MIIKFFFSLIFFSQRPYCLFFSYLKYNYYQLLVNKTVVQGSYLILHVTKSYPTLSSHYSVFYQPLFHKLGLGSNPIKTLNIK